MIKPLLTDLSTPDCVPSRKKLMEKLNEVISELNNLNKEEPLAVSALAHRDIQQTHPLIFDGYSPIGGVANATYFMPPAGVGHVESDGTIIQGMISRNRLPAHVLNHFNTLTTNG